MGLINHKLLFLLVILTFLLISNMMNSKSCEKCGHTTCNDRVKSMVSKIEEKIVIKGGQVQVDPVDVVADTTTKTRCSRCGMFGHSPVTCSLNCEIIIKF